MEKKLTLKIEHLYIWYCFWRIYFIYSKPTLFIMYFINATGYKYIYKVLVRHSFHHNRIDGVMVMLASSAVDCGFKPRSGQAKDY
jgi:hypothetical protein